MVGVFPFRDMLLQKGDRVTADDVKYLLIVPEPQKKSCHPARKLVVE